MSATLYDHSTRYIELRMRELHAEATRARLGRQMRDPRPPRHRLGRLLISVGEALSAQPQAPAAAD
jgi:hypothetical protein